MDEGKQSPPVQAEQREEWVVPVLDAVRLLPCELIVAVADNRVVVVPPTPTGYVVPPQSIQSFCDALRTANNVARHRGLIVAMDAER